MALFKKLFKKGNKPSKKTKKNQAKLTIKAIDRQTPKAVSVSFDVPASEKENFQFIPGQYLNFTVNTDGDEHKRAYSICSGIDESLSIAVKEVEMGAVSSWFNHDAKVGDKIIVNYPAGNFLLKDAGKKYVAFAAGSGITPIMSMAKAVHLSTEGNLQLFYGNSTPEDVIFKEELAAIQGEKIQVTHCFSQKKETDSIAGRLDKKTVTNIIKKDVDLLKSDGFYICGPEEMIVDVQEALKTFGVPDEKIHFELFTTPTILKKEEETVQESFEGESKVTVILDDEETVFELAPDGDFILDEVEANGIDAPYSCRGGVCCTCRAKILKGSAKMDNNMSLTDSEIEEGFILTCQAHPTSKEIVISYDE